MTTRDRDARQISLRPPLRLPGMPRIEETRPADWWRLCEEELDRPGLRPWEVEAEESAEPVEPSDG